MSHPRPRNSIEKTADTWKQSASNSLRLAPRYVVRTGSPHSLLDTVNHPLITRMPDRNRDGTRTDSLVVVQLLEHHPRHARAHPKRRHLRPERHVAQEERTSTHVLMPRAMGALQRLRLQAMLRVMAKNTLAKKVCIVRFVIKPLRGKTI